MLKKFIFMLVLTAIIIVAMPQAQQVIQYLINAHDLISQALKEVFSGGHIGNALRGFIAFLTIPFAIGAIPSALYWLVRKHWCPWFMDIVWIIWLVQAGALLSIYRMMG